MIWEMLAICDSALESQRDVWPTKKIEDCRYKWWIEKEDSGMKVGKEWPGT